MLHNPNNDDAPAFPQIESRIGENPARWLHGLEELTPLVDSLIRGIVDRERALNWRFVARSVDAPTHIRDRIDHRIDRLEKRPVAHDVQAQLRELHHATPSERARIRDRVLEDNLDGAATRVLVGYAETLKSVLSTDGEPAESAPATDPSSETVAESDQDEPTSDTTETKMSIDRARELVETMDFDRVDSLISLERDSSEPRENVLTALRERRNELSDDDRVIAGDTQTEVRADV